MTLTGLLLYSPYFGVFKNLSFLPTFCRKLWKSFVLLASRVSTYFFESTSFSKAVSCLSITSCFLSGSLPSTSVLTAETDKLEPLNLPIAP